VQRLKNKIHCILQIKKTWYRCLPK